MRALLTAPLTLVGVAAVAGLAWPSERLAEEADLILAALVLATALSIDPQRFRKARGHWRAIAAAVLLPLLLLIPLALGLAALFEGDVHDGLIALGLASSEVAARLVAIAAAMPRRPSPRSRSAVRDRDRGAARRPAPDRRVDRRPAAARPLQRGGARSARGRSARADSRGGERLDRAAELAATVVLAVLVYASLGGLGELSELGDAALASLLFLAGSAAIALLLRPVLGELNTGGLVFALRDFAVAAALAVQLGSPGAAATPAVYGVLMLVLAAALAPRLGASRLSGAG